LPDGAHYGDVDIREDIRRYPEDRNAAKNGDPYGSGDKSVWAPLL